MNARFVTADFSETIQGYDLIAKRLAARGLGKHVGYTPHGLRRFIGACLARLPRYRGLARNDAYHLWLLSCAGWRGKAAPLHHVIWGDALAMRIRTRGRYTLTIHQPHELWPAGFADSLRRASGIVTVTEREAAYIRALYPQMPVRCVRNPVDVDFFRPPTTKPAGNKVIVAAGRHLRNHSMFMRVASRLIQERPDVEFRVLLNPGFKWPNEVAAMQPTKRFTVVQALSVDQLRDFYQVAHAACMPYNNVTASNSICESLACGVPVVTTRVGGMETYLEDGSLILVENNRDDDMLAQLHRLLDDPTWHQTCRQSARAFAEKALHWPVILDDLESFLRGVDATPQ